MKVLLTGATGFLGSHIAEELVGSGFEVIALKRENSDCWRCAEIKENIEWINLDGAWHQKVRTKKPDAIIHVAWSGVEGGKREQEELQEQNLVFLDELLELARSAGVKKFVALGSQAEYGVINRPVTEDDDTVPVNAYGKAKKLAAERVKAFCEQNNINWIWLRLFSFFGEKENDSWLIPSVIRKMQSDTSMDVTAGEQKYAYMYVRDFAAIVHKIISGKVESGIYNVSSKNSISLQELLRLIQAKVNPEFVLNFGAIPYRPDQSMHIEGDIRKLLRQIGDFNFTPLETALEKTIQYYLSKNESIRLHS